MLPSRRSTFRHLLLCAALLLPAVSPPRAQGVGVTLRITLSADSEEILHAWRRAQGLEPPDPAADERVRQAAMRRAAERAEAQSPEAARRRRMARTVELVDTPVIQVGY